MPKAASKTAPVDASRREAVLTSATVRAAKLLGVSNTMLGGILGLSPSTVSRMAAGSYRLSYGSKPFEVAQLFLRMFRSLDSIVGGDGGAAQSWLATENTALRGKPIERIQGLVGLVETVTYLDSRRAIV